MNADFLIREQAEIDREVKAIAQQLNAEAVYDGVISPEHFVARPVKISWVLREPHDSGGDYDYKAGIIDRLRRNDIGRNKYFDPMRYLEYSLRNNFVLWDKIPDSDKDREVSNLLLYTAFTNINKIVGGANVNYEVFWNHVDRFSNVVRRQIAVSNPTVIIASGTIEFFRKNGFLDGASIHPKSYRNYYVTEKHLILDCYHLGQHTISQERLCDDIILALQDANARGSLSF